MVKSGQFCKATAGKLNHLEENFDFRDKERYIRKWEILTTLPGEKILFSDCAKTNCSFVNVINVKPDYSRGNKIVFKLPISTLPGSEL